MAAPPAGSPTPSESQLSSYRLLAADPKQVEQYADALQQKAFLRSVQSKCVSFVVGPEQHEFSVHKGLIVRYSPVFTKMCHLPFKEAKQGVMRLPEDDPSTFGEFVCWIYKATPCVDGNNTSVSSLVKLGIFAEKYQVPPLVEQIYDDLLVKMYPRYQPNNSFQLLAPSDIRAIFEGTSAKSLLRRFCCLYLSERWEPTRRKLSRKWERLFEEVAELGWYYFKMDKTRDDSRNAVYDYHRRIPWGSSNLGTGHRYKHFLSIADIDEALKKSCKIDPDFFDQEAWDSLYGQAPSVEDISTCSSDVDDEEEEPYSEPPPKEQKRDKSKSKH